LPKPSKTEEKVRQVIDTGVELLPEIFEMLLDEAKGVHFVVSPLLPGRMKPKHGAALVTEAEEVEKVCRSCKQPILKEPRQVWEVWKEKRDATTLRYLHDQIAGRSKARENEKVDTEIYVIFGDIDSLPPGETKGVNGENGLKGSLPRMSLDDLIEDVEQETPDLGV
jgi:hypothetical protein